MEFLHVKYRFPPCSNTSLQLWYARFFLSCSWLIRCINHALLFPNSTAAFTLPTWGRWFFSFQGAAVTLLDITDACSHVFGYVPLCCNPERFICLVLSSVSVNRAVWPIGFTVNPDVGCWVEHLDHSRSDWCWRISCSRSSARFCFSAILSLISWGTCMWCLNRCN